MFRGLLSVAVLVVIPTVALAQQPCTTDARHVVNELYRHMLERSADPSSAGWVEKLQNGSATVRGLVREIAKSPEHAQRFYNPGEGSVAHERAVATLYRHILGRQPDQGGLNAFTTFAMSNGLGAVVDRIVDSAEYSQTYGEWGVPGSGGVRYCGNAASSAVGTAGVATPQIRWANQDVNHDGIIQRNEWRGNARAFNLRDWNGDGVLSGDEVRVGADAPANAAAARDYRMETSDRFAYLDVNNNGSIDRNEWDGSLDAFYRLDRNNDARVTRNELGNTTNPAPFAMMDTNSDGRITLAEWPYSHRSFDQQDENGDGAISAREFNVNALPGAN